MPSQAREDETPTAFAIRVVKEQGAKDFAAELRERLVKADSELKRSAESSTDNSAAGMDHGLRLKSKAVGIRLALSYLDEMTRGL
jgi:hypothetical protein